MSLPTEGDRIVFDDIRDQCTQDPVTKQWSGDTVAIAAMLNDDFRHDRDTEAALVFALVWDELQLLTQNRGKGLDPNDDDYFWEGLFDEAHRNLPDAGRVNKLLRESYSDMITRGPETEAPARVVPGYAPMGEVDDRRQRNGLLLDQWNKITQDLVMEPAYDPQIDPQYKNNQEAVRDKWFELTGGRRFGACTPASVQATIDNQNQVESRDEAFRGTEDVFARTQAANAAANAEYQDPNSTRQSVNDAGDAAYAAG